MPPPKVRSVPSRTRTAESVAATFETNVLGVVVLSMKHEVRAMQAQGRGNIINISSTYGHEGAANASIYVGAKHAVEGITSQSVALELAKSGIRVNAVAPGPTDTGMLTCFTHTAENKAALATQVPLGRLRPLRGSRRRHRVHRFDETKPGSSRDMCPQRRWRTHRQLILSERGGSLRTR